MRVTTGVLSAGLLVGLIAFAGAARADETASTPAQAEEPKPLERWYGWQILLSDLAVAGLVSGSVLGQVDNAWPLAIGATTYVTVPPIVHGFHHNSVGLGASIGMRLLLPVVAGVAALGMAERAIAACQDRGGWFCGLDDLAYGWLAGMGMASVIDVSVLAWERGPTPPSDTATAATGSPAVLPSVSVARDAERRWVPMLAVGGAF